MKHTVTTDSDIFPIITELRNNLDNEKFSEVIVKVPHDQKSLEQLGYFFGGCYGKVIKTKGFENITAEQFADAMCEIAAKAYLPLPNGLQLEYVIRISAMDTREMSALIDATRLFWWDQFQIDIETPDEYKQRKYNERQEK